MIIEHSYVAVAGKASKRQMSVSSDRDIPGLEQLASAIHANEAKAAVQINHAGSTGIADEVMGTSVVAHLN